MIIVFNRTSLLTGLLIFLPIIAKSQLLADKTIEFKKESTLIIQGTTNVIKFECILNEKDDTSIFATYEYTDSTLLLHNALLTFYVDDFDCGKKAITEDFKKALRSIDFPRLMLDLNQINSTAEERLQIISSVNSDVSITIAGVMQDFTINFQRHILNDSTIFLSGEKLLLMSNFEVNPPQALWGAVKANDEINVSFELILIFK